MIGKLLAVVSQISANNRILERKLDTIVQHLTSNSKIKTKDQVREPVIEPPFVKQTIYQTQTVHGNEIKSDKLSKR